MGKPDKRKLASKGNGKAPISSHPIFPAIVALWFAALFGIGSFVLPNVLIEKFVTAIGLPLVISAAAPPLGVTAKLGLAVIAAALGAVAGLFIARKVVESQAQMPVRNRELGSTGTTHAKRPIVATEELGEEGLGPVPEDESWGEDSAAPMSGPKLPGRRRALSVTDDSGPSEYLASVPLPGEDPYSSHDDAFATLELVDEEESDAFAKAEAHAEEHADAMQGLRNDSFAMMAEAETEVEDLDDSGAAANEDPITGSPITGSVIGGRPFDVPGDLPRTQECDLPTAGYAAAEQTVADHGANLARAPIQFAVPSEETSMTQQPHPQGETYNPFAAHAAETPAAEAPRQVFGQQPSAAPFAAPAEYAAPVTPFAASSPAAAPTSMAPAAAPLAELSMSELIQRFARSMQVDSAQASAEELSPDAGADNAVPLAPPPEPVAEAPFVAPDHSPVPSPAPAGDFPMPFTFQRGGDQAVTQFAPAPAPAPAFAPAASAQAVDQNVGAEAPAFAAPASTAPASASPAAAFETQQPSVPAALRPLDLGDFDEEDDEDDPFAGGLNLGIRAGHDPATNPFAAPVAMQEDDIPAPTAEFDDDSDTGNDDGYSSLLSMKSPLGASREFVRVEEDEYDAGRPPEPVVTFPGQGDAPATSAPVAAPGGDAARPFDAPPGGGQRTAGLAPAVPTNPVQKQADPAETEKALREALEKLQRMSGAA